MVLVIVRDPKELKASKFLYGGVVKMVDVAMVKSQVKRCLISLVLRINSLKYHADIITQQL
jgi:hypothetical protein